MLMIILKLSAMTVVLVASLKIAMHGVNKPRKHLSDRQLIELIVFID